jgi:hypothetical protein
VGNAVICFMMRNRDKEPRHERQAARLKSRREAVVLPSEAGGHHHPERPVLRPVVVDQRQGDLG